MFPVQLFTIIATLAEHNQRLSDRLEGVHREAITDSLTGLYNRRAFHQWTEYQLQLELIAHVDWQVAILDIDHFKAYNDEYGHEAGDIALKLFAESLISCTSLLRKSYADIHLFRWGGEEFMVVSSCAAKQMRGLLEIMRHAVIVKSYDLPREITFSAGYTALNLMECDRSIQAADAALYKAKVTRNCVREADQFAMV